MLFKIFVEVSFNGQRAQVVVVFHWEKKNAQTRPKNEEIFKKEGLWILIYTVSRKIKAQGSLEVWTCKNTKYVCHMGL